LPRADIRAAVAAILAIALRGENKDGLPELDVNPLLLRPEGNGAIAVDALIVETSS
jgi:hypothetical protein